MLLNNYSVRDIGKTKGVGGSLDPTTPWVLSKRMTIFYPDKTISGENQRTSFPMGLTEPHAVLLPIKIGGMASIGYINGQGLISALGQNGLPAEATLTGSGLVSDAAMGLIVEMLATLIGSSTFESSIIGQIEAVATLAGSGDLNSTVSAMAELTATLIGSGVITGNLIADGSMTANIYVNQSTASTEQLVAAIWNALTTQFNNPGTMGKAVSDAGSAGNPWSAQVQDNNDPGSFGSKVGKLNNPTLVLKDGTII